MMAVAEEAAEAEEAAMAAMAAIENGGIESDRDAARCRECQFQVYHDICGDRF